MNINMHTSHPSAFISSTFVDLCEDRAAIAEALKKRGLNVNALDIRPASSQSSKNEILSGIRESDFVILVIGNRFGSILKSMTGNDNISVTWWEYNNAMKMGKPVIAYFKNIDPNDPATHDDESDIQYQKKRKLFERFKKIVTRRHNPAFYTTAYDLADQVDNSLISIYRAGVKKISSSNSNLMTKVSKLESEISSLKSTSTRIQSNTNTTINSTRGLLSLGLLESAKKEENTVESRAHGLLGLLNENKT